MRKRAIYIRFLHKWLGLLLGLQVLIWLSSGLYMVLLDIDFIHGDSLVKNMQQTVAMPQNSAIDMAGLRARYANATAIRLIPVMGKTHFAVSTPDKNILIDPESGNVISPLDEKTSTEIARYHFNGDAGVKKARLITSDPPMEIQTRQLPLWRVDFDDGYNTSFYVDPFTGTLITRRFQYWRIFDFMWMLHIMDYQERANAHNLLLKSAQASSLLFCISGLWLLFYSFSGRRRKDPNRKAMGGP